MEFDDLKKVWKQQKTNKNINYSQSELMMFINNKVISFEQEIKSRDRREVIVALFLIIVFGVTFFTTDSLWQQAGCLTIIGSAVFIWYRLKTTQIHTGDEQLSPDKTMGAHLLQELKSLQQQRGLLKRIGWWYIAPIVLGLLLFAIGFESGWLFRGIYMAIVFIIGIITWKINQNAVRNRYDPLIEDIENAIEFIENEKKTKCRAQGNKVTRYFKQKLNS